MPEIAANWKEPRMTGKPTAMERWLPIIIQTIAFIGIGFSYTTALEHRLTVNEQTISTNGNVLADVRRLLESQEARLRILEVSQTVISQNQTRSMEVDEYLLKLKRDSR